MKDILKEITKEIKSSDDIKPELEEGQKDMLDCFLLAGRRFFDRDHHIQPVFAVMDGLDMHPYPIHEITPENKHDLFDKMHELVRKHECCIFINEVWYCQALPSEAKDGKFLLQPSQRPDREEMVMINVWVGTKRHLGITAQIHRNPDKLGPWRLMDDTADTTRDCHSKGAMIEPEGGWSE